MEKWSEIVFVFAGDDRRDDLVEFKSTKKAGGAGASPGGRCSALQTICWESSWENRRSFNAVAVDKSLRRPYRTTAIESA